MYGVQYYRCQYRTHYCIPNDKSYVANDAEIFGAYLAFELLRFFTVFAEACEKEAWSVER